MSEKKKTAQKGLGFVKVNALGLYHFQKCEPDDIIYQLDYTPDNRSEKNEYIQMFRDCGWEYLQDYLGYSYFRKPASEMDGKEEEIFCDDASRLDMMKRVFTGRMIPLLVCFFCIIIPQLIMSQHLHTAFRRGLDIFFTIALFVYLGIFISFALQFRKYYRSVHKK